LKNLMSQLVDAGTGLAGAGVASDEPATTELVAPPDETSEFGDTMFPLRVKQQTRGHDEQQNTKSQDDRLEPVGSVWQPDGQV
jgi:hypothetical protein